MKRILSVFLAVLLLALCLSPTAFFVVSAGEVSASDWMSRVPGDALLCNLNIPGTHDTGMYDSQWIMWLYAQTQNLDITEQLEAGVRIMDIRLRYGGEGELYLCHGAKALCCDAYDGAWGALSGHLTYAMVMEQLDDFLSKHDTETVIISTQHEYEAEDVVDGKGTFNTCKKDVEDKYASRILRYDPGHIYLFQAYDASDPNMTYRVTAYEDADGNVSLDSYEKVGKNERLDVPEEWKKLLRTPDEYDKEMFETATADLPVKLVVTRTVASRVAKKCTVTMQEAKGKIVMFPYGTGLGDLMEPDQNRFQLRAVEKWNAIRPFFNNAEDQQILSDIPDVVACYTSCTGMRKINDDGETVRNGLTDLPLPGEQAAEVNPKIMGYNFLKGKHYGWVVMDYVTEDLCRKVYQSNNFGNEALTYYISEIRGYCGDEKNGNKEDLEETILRCENDGYFVLSTDGLVDVNPKGYSMVIGYRLSTNRKNAITDIKGAYGDHCPDGYTKVKVDNSWYNYFTRGSGDNSKDTYLYYKKDEKANPVVGLSLLPTTGNVTQEGNKTFNLDEGLGITIGLDMKFMDDPKPNEGETADSPELFTGTFLIPRVGQLHGLLTAVVLLAVILTVTLEHKYRKKKRGMTKAA